MFIVCKSKKSSKSRKADRFEKRGFGWFISAGETRRLYFQKSSRIRALYCGRCVSGRFWKTSERQEISGNPAFTGKDFECGKGKIRQNFNLKRDSSINYCFGNRNCQRF